MSCNKERKWFNGLYKDSLSGSRVASDEGKKLTALRHADISCTNRFVVCGRVVVVVFDVT